MLPEADRSRHGTTATVHLTLSLEKAVTHVKVQAGLSPTYDNKK